MIYFCYYLILTQAMLLRQQQQKHLRNIYIYLYIVLFIYLFITEKKLRRFLDVATGGRRCLRNDVMEAKANNRKII